MSTNKDVMVRDFRPGDVIRTGVGSRTVDSIAVGRVWATVRLHGERTPMRLQIDEIWTVRRG